MIYAAGHAQSDSPSRPPLMWAECQVVKRLIELYSPTTQSL